MKCNVGKIDKVIRIILGLSLITFGILFNSWLGYVGIIPIVTAVFGFCPMYPIARLNTCKK